MLNLKTPLMARVSKLPLRALTATVVAGFALVWLCGCDPVDADFFPLNEGNVWLYDWSRVDRPGTSLVAAPAPAPATAAGSNHMWTVADTPEALAEREAAAAWQKAGATSILLKQASPASSIEYNGEYRPGGTCAVRKLNGILEIETASNLQETALLQLSVKLLVYPVFSGAKWEEPAAGTNGQVALAMDRLVGFETVETPAGRFFKCAHVVRVIDPRITNGLAMFMRVQHYWLAPDVGLVKVLYENDNGPALRAELRAFRLTPIPADLADRQQDEMSRTMEPDGMVIGGRPAGAQALSPEEMHRRYLYTTHDDFRR